MRFLSVPIALFLVLACSASGAMEPPAFAGSVAAGSIQFTIDPVSCVYSGARPITFMIDNADVGTENLAPGQTSQAYAASGTPWVQARIANWTSVYFTTATTLWTLRKTVTVPSSGSVTHVVTC